MRQLHIIFREDREHLIDLDEVRRITTAPKTSKQFRPAYRCRCDNSGILEDVHALQVHLDIECVNASRSLPLTVAGISGSSSASNIRCQRLPSWVR